MNCFTVATLLALGVTAFANTPNLETLRKALSTNQRIWTTRRSYERHTGDQKHQCVYAWKTYMDSENYYFDQYYRYGTNTWVRHPLRARLSEGQSGPVLTVRQPSGQKETPYILLYWDEAKNCGVLTFENSTTGEYECELHVGDSNQLQNEDTPCDHDYDTHCQGKKKYRVYEPDCSSHSPQGQ
uniref:Putative licpodalin-4 1 n=1 Tax=Amblyomma cajennense TaxID=34607 RepID=A0A023FQI8_AMBCJ